MKLKIMIVLICALFLCQCTRIDNVAQDTAKVQQLPEPAFPAYVLCKQFVLSKLLGNRGDVYTNYIQTPSDGLTRGHDALSESQGLLMQIAVKADDRQLFERVWGYAKENMQSDNSLFSWRIVEGTKADSSATIDDLRIVDALFSASQVWKTNAYDADITQISDALLSECIKGSLPITAYDFSTEAGTDEVQLSYLDLQLMQRLASKNEKWQKVYNKSKQLISKGIVSRALPLYRPKWDIGEHQFESSDKFNMIDSLLVEYHLVQIGSINEKHLDWLKTQLAQGQIYCDYNANGEAVSAGESTAVYAITMLIAKEAKNTDLYALARDRMLKFQVSDATSEIYGAFGDESDLQVYSFDNLMSLLAF